MRAVKIRYLKMPWSGGTVLFAIALWGTLIHQNEADVCPNLQIVTDFSIQEYKGKWYEIESTPEPLELGGRCITMTYTDADHKSMYVQLDMEIHRTGKNPRFYGILDSVNKINNESKFILHFLTASENGEAVTTDPYWILATDYKSYSIAWSCKLIQVASLTVPKHRVWILGREKTMNKKTYAKVESILELLTDVFPRYILKETIPCSGAGPTKIHFLLFLVALAVEMIFH